jgi:hypothetical protein
VTLEELEKTLPNGLHDSEVQRVAVDYEKGKVALDVAVWVGSMNDPPEQREAYKSGRIEISGLVFFVMEPPDPKYPFRDSLELTVDGCDMSKNLDGELLKSLPSDAFFRSLWVNEWNAFIHIAARDAEIAWMNDGTVTYR